MTRERAVAEAAELMRSFADRTGLDSEHAPRRYLWTDAFAVCNFLALERATGAGPWGELALRLVEQVHRTLGRHRDDDARRGWISGLGEREGERHPTRGGLRIGKPLPERSRGEPFDERLEWDRDGQYFHYLTRWMHALDQVARATGLATFNTWARELAETAHRSFTWRAPDGRLRMVWKMSIDLSRPLVPSMGHHDPLDGLITCVQLQTTARGLAGAPVEPDLDDAVADFAGIARGGSWATADPLGLGGLLIDACRVAHLMGEGFAGSRLLETLLAAALEGLAQYARQGATREPASQRLAFRELGLAIGLSALEPIAQALCRGDRPRDGDGVRARLEALSPHRRLGCAIESFWLRPEARRTRLWREHRDINEVMLATCLVPDGLLVPPTLPAGPPPD